MSKHILTLDNPITITRQIDGKVVTETVTELSYDPLEITADQFSLACAKSAAMDKNKAFTFKMKENDYALHLYLGMMAVIAVNPHIDLSDLEKIKGFDVLDLTNIGTFFIMRRLAVPSEESASDSLSEATENTTTAAPENSGK